MIMVIIEIYNHIFQAFTSTSNGTSYCWWLKSCSTRVWNPENNGRFQLPTSTGARRISEPSTVWSTNPENFRQNPPGFNHHHQDYYMFNRESQPKPFFATIASWVGGRSKVYHPPWQNPNVTQGTLSHRPCNGWRWSSLLMATCSTH